MEYRLVFDLLDSGYRQWTFGAFGFLFIIAGIIMNKYRSFLFRKWPEKWSKVFARFWLGFAIFWTTTSYLGTYSDYHNLKNAYEKQTYETVDGRVERFVPMPYAGHSMESFEVNGNKFEYSDFNVSAGFNNTASHGGPIKEGRQVRIWHVRNAIIRLEVLEENEN